MSEVINSFISEAVDVVDEVSARTIDILRETKDAAADVAEGAVHVIDGGADALIDEIEQARAHLVNLLKIAGGVASVEGDE